MVALRMLGFTQNIIDERTNDLNLESKDMVKKSEHSIEKVNAGDKGSCLRGNKVPCEVSHLL